MATQSLYRRYRPRKFSEVKGQDHVVRALRDAVVAGREGQAYLFSGPRGTGKTTSARILAKVLNCSNVIDGEPCCECDSCFAVEKGTSYDVHELDAASNNGVEAIRDLIEKASLGTPGRHKVYILDEVHMLSKAAEAALLKTLEEPPPHVVFVLATTDPQKMSDTIRSRTQHLQFHLLPADTLAEHVKWVAHDAGYDLSPEAIESALVQGGGSARDTLSALELIASTGGEVDDAVNLDEFIAAMIDHDAGRALTAMAHAVTLGRDPRNITEELVRHLRNAFLSLMAPELVMLPSERLDALSLQAQQVGAAGLVRAIEKLGTTLVDMRSAPDPRVLVEVVLVQLTHPDASGDVEALMARIERLEQKVKSFGDVGPAKATLGPTDPATGRAVLGGAARRPVDSTQSIPSSGTPETAKSSPMSRVDEPVEARDQASDHQRPSADQSERTRAENGLPMSGDARATGPKADNATRSGGPPAAERAVLGSGARRPAPDLPMISADRSADESAHSVTAQHLATGPPPSGPTQAEGTATQPTGLSVPDAWDRSLKSTITPLMVRALFAAGTFVEGSGERWKFDLPSPAHATRCEPHRAAIESQLSALVGHAVSIEFVTGTARDAQDGGANTGGHRDVQEQQSTDMSVAVPKAPSKPAIERAKAAAAAVVEEEVAAVADEPVFEADDEIDLSDLTDAPPESVRTPLDKLTEAFPGSQFITDD